MMFLSKIPPSTANYYLNLDQLKTREHELISRAEVEKIIEETPFTSAAIIGRQYGVNKKTIRRVWSDIGINHGIAARKPKLTEAQKEARMGYALENLTRDWNNVLFSDEKTYQTDRHQKLHVCRPKNSRFNERYIQKSQRSGRISAGFWGWIGRDGPGELVPISRRLNSDGYLEILEEILKPTVDICFGGFKDIVFMQRCAEIVY
ncbi:hypothetical protein HA402_005576 [Bradysia odoriphaga]|nr:hypothetical protein HA402_005576 [Bradysia odoriphaga]